MPLGSGDFMSLALHFFFFFVIGFQGPGQLTLKSKIPHPKEKRTETQLGICIPKFIAAFTTIAQK